MRGKKGQHLRPGVMARQFSNYSTPASSGKGSRTDLRAALATATSCWRHASSSGQSFLLLTLGKEDAEMVRLAAYHYSL